MTKDEAISKVLSIAKAEIGYHEKASNSNLDDKVANSGGANYTKYARDLDRVTNFYNGAKNGFAWCDVFFDWLFYTAFGADMAKKLLCQPDSSAGAGCYYSALYYREKGQFHATSPQPGDQIFFTYAYGEVSHTGIVEAVVGNTVTTIEGNSSDGVNRRQYSTGSSNIYGYGRPDWSAVAVIKEDLNTKPKTDEHLKNEGENLNTANYSITLPVIENGSVGEFVKSVQILLIAHGHYCGGRIVNKAEIPDGEFGTSTENSVKLFQLANGLPRTGKVDMKTMRFLLTKQ